MARVTFHPAIRPGYLVKARRCEICEYDEDYGLTPPEFDYFKSRGKVESS